LVPIYPTLLKDQVEYIVRNCGAKLCVVGSAEHDIKYEGLPKVPLMPLKPSRDSKSLKRSEDNIMARAEQAQPLSADELLERSRQLGEEDVATIIYTSGTTGFPKGVMLPHRAILHVSKTAAPEFHFTQEDRFLCFLPMSHVFERVCGQVFPISQGSSIAFARSVLTLSSDMQSCNPTIMLVVPRFLDATRDRVLDTVAKASPIRQKLFAWAVDQGVKKAKGEPAPFAGFLDKLVMSKIRARLGGRLRLLISGGAALPEAVAEFYMALGVPVLQGYGLTETAGGSVINREHDNKYWTVGEPLDMEIEIAEDGEILMRGRGLMLGYFNDPEATSQAIDENGWFHTGDIGCFEGKHLRITDRKKDLLVLANGKNVAPQPIETLLKSSAMISEAVLFGDGMDYVCALIMPNHAHVRTELGIPEGKETSDEELAEREDVRALIKKEITTVNSSLPDFERVKRFAILPSPLSIENGELTPTLKVKRNVVKDRYFHLLDQR
jgi:long-chain acyl-CoA synthetase